jgi:hypothetical protein
MGPDESEDAGFGNVLLARGSPGAISVAAVVPKSYMNVCGGSIGALARRLGLLVEAVNIFA